MILAPYRYAAGGGLPVIEAFSTAGVSPSTSLTATDPGGITANELLMLLVIYDNGSVPVVTTPAGWTRFAEYADDGAGFELFRKIASGSEGDVVLTLTSTNAVVWYLRVSGADTTTPINVLGVYRNWNNPASVTTDVDNCLAFVIDSHDGGSGVPFDITDTDWTIQAESQSDFGGNDVSGCWATKEMPTAGATGVVTITNADGNDESCVQFAIAPA
jgi:hypothetical protein